MAIIKDIALDLNKKVFPVMETNIRGEIQEYRMHILKDGIECPVADVGTISRVGLHYYLPVSKAWTYRTMEIDTSETNLVVSIVCEASYVFAEPGLIRSYVEIETNDPRRRYYTSECIFNLIDVINS